MASPLAFYPEGLMIDSEDTTAGGYGAVPVKMQQKIWQDTSVLYSKQSGLRKT
ncbi:MAG: hypothetical protein JNJ94_04665 [Chlorobi bacterium]|nr:hypothetical protein [Chlorobiota bacterium]